MKKNGNALTTEKSLVKTKTEAKLKYKIQKKYKSTQQNY